MFFLPLHVLPDLCKPVPVLPLLLLLAGVPIVLQKLPALRWCWLCLLMFPGAREKQLPGLNSRLGLVSRSTRCGRARG